MDNTHIQDIVNIDNSVKKRQSSVENLAEARQK